MSSLNRRELLQTSLAALGAQWGLGGNLLGAESQELRLSRFRIDATPPLGHPCCGGWIPPIQVVDDPQWAQGIVLHGNLQPVVIVAVDWTGILNASYEQLRQALAQAVGTEPSRVAIQCVHPHNAPFADGAAEKLIAAAPAGAPSTLNLEFFDAFTEKMSAAAKACLAESQPVTHVGVGQGKVAEVAANRRLKGDDGKLMSMRGSACKDPVLRALPEGLIDPFLKTVSLWNGDQALAALHYYACHPMSYYGDGRCTPDFCGLARELRREADPKVLHLYFDGCGGNIAAGKYNDGSPEMRGQLRDRILAGMEAAWQATEKSPIGPVSWRVEPVKLPPREEAAYSVENLKSVLNNKDQSPALRGRAAMNLAYLARLDRPIDISCLDLGPAEIVHLPGEPFIEYQLFAQKQRPDRFVCVAGYGDGGTWYIPTAAAYPEGGYEVSVSWVAPASEEILHRAMQQVLKA